jgi:hypothetical protein
VQSLPIVVMDFEPLKPNFEPLKHLLWKKTHSKGAY